MNRRFATIYGVSSLNDYYSITDFNSFSHFPSVAPESPVFDTLSRHIPTAGTIASMNTFSPFTHRPMVSLEYVKDLHTNTKLDADAAKPLTKNFHRFASILRPTINIVVFNASFPIKALSESHLWRVAKMVDPPVLRERDFTVLKEEEEEVAKPVPSESLRRRRHFRTITGSMSDLSYDYDQRPECFIYIKVSHHNFKPSLLEALQNQMRSAQATNIENSSEAKDQRANTTISFGTRPKQSRFFPRSSKDSEENRTGELTKEVDEHGFKSANFGDDEDMEKEDHSTSSITTWFG